MNALAITTIVVSIILTICFLNLAFIFSVGQERYYQQTYSKINTAHSNREMRSDFSLFMFKLWAFAILSAVAEIICIVKLLQH